MVDTSVWSLARRRDPPLVLPQVTVLPQALESQAIVVTAGLVPQELLQGFTGPRARKDIIEHFGALPMITPSRKDHIVAAELWNTCRRAGVQMGTIDALLAQLCIHHGLTLLTTDRDLSHAALHCQLKVWA